MKKRVMLILSCLFLSIGFITAQTTRVTGVVIDDIGEPVVGASVVVKGTTVGTITELDGTFSINVPEGRNTLVFSLVGMQAVESRVSPNMKVTLKSNETALDEIIVTGYGVTKKTAFTGSASVIDSKVITARTDADFTKSLQGSVTGVMLNGNSSAPGASGSITIRGVGSYNASTSPLYIVDGTPLITEEMAMSSANKQIFSPMANLNPADIENITVLKDAAATAIYGSRAANGVIVITTKNGSADKLSINLRLKKGFTKMAPVKDGYKLLNDKEWLDAWAKGIVNSGEQTSYESAYQAALTAAKDEYGYRGVNNDWVDAVTRTGNVDEYSIDFSGKSGNTSYFASGGYFKNEGVIIATGVERYTGRFNLNTKYKFITFGANLSGSSSTSNGAPTSSAYVNPLVAVYGAVNPMTPIYNEDGSYNLDAYYNPVAINDHSKGDLRRQKFNSLNVNPYIALDLSHGFYWKSSVGYNMLDLNEYQFWSNLNPQGANYNGLGQKYNETRKGLTFTNTLNWLHTFGNVHSLNL
ncbi:MAG: SusC/RagA family TonB-linked outer membrane protein, partial [Prevotella sp.]|nr:SusC/RagA family TonB-linked outer membrane protein [Prevotella sp.]